MAAEKRLIAESDIYKLFDKTGFARLHVGDIDVIPRVDAVEVVHGEWVFGELDVFGAPVKCSNCGWGVDNADPILWMDYPAHRFCGNCGAKMDGERKTDD